MTSLTGDVRRDPHCLLIRDRPLTILEMEVGKQKEHPEKEAYGLSIFG